MVKAGDCYICTDEGMDLERASIFPEEVALFSWLETVATEHLEDDRVGFLSCFCTVKELITDTVAREMEKLIIEAPE